MAEAKKKLRVLWVDDAKSLRELYFTVLELNGWLEQIDVKFVGDGDEAERELVEQPPDIFVTDIEHPGQHLGILLERLDAKKVTYPILIVTACNIEVIKGFTDGRCPNLNVSFIEKPFDVEDLHKVFGGFLQAAKQSVASD